jgi:hypothetical protein
MAMATPLSASKMPWRARLTRLFIWVSVLAWGILLGAKLFDLRVLAGAWSASSPASLKLLPYGSQYPVDTGEFLFTARLLYCWHRVGPWLVAGACRSGIAGGWRFRPL